MKRIVRKIIPAALACALALGASGCYFGMNNYNRYRNQIKTTAAPESVEEMLITDLKHGDEYFEMKGLPWGSTLSEFQEFVGVPVSETTSFTEGESMADINYSVRLADAITVGMEPVFSKEGGLMSISVYFQTVYTAEQLDAIYDRVIALAEKAFGEKEKETSEESSSSNVTYTTTVSFWYAEKSESEMTTLQIGKINSGNGTDAVVVGINCYDPALVEEKTSSEAETE